MGYLVSIGILFIIVFIVIGVVHKTIIMKTKGKEVSFFTGFQLLSLLTLILLVPSFLAIVPANNVGIVYSAISGTKDDTLGEGYHMKSPLDKVYNISTEVKTVTVEDLTTQTLDSQYVTSQLDIKYKVNSSNAYIVFKQFKTIENMDDQLIVSTTQRVLEKITTTYNVMDILGESRTEIYERLEEALKVEFEKSGVDFYSISITDMDAGAEIEAAITAEAVAKKAVETATQELEKARTESQKAVVEAQAEQDAAKIAAETMVISAQAEADANQILTESLTDLIIQKMMINKWDGILPKVTGTGDMLFDVSSLTE